MSKLSKPVELETTFGVYTATEVIGEGGAGRVYGGVASDGAAVAIKVLNNERASTENRRRFKNEIAFLALNKHANIVTVADHGVVRTGSIVGPFYVMRRYAGSLRDLMRSGIAPDSVMPLFSQIIDGVEAAHLQGAVHRDLKPENILHEKAPAVLAVADFGIASFTVGLMATPVQTPPDRRIANFQYAAPEQRTAGQAITAAADIYALGLMLNEMFTQAVPHGTGYRHIAQVSESFAFLDPIVSAMLAQNPAERPKSIAVLKALIQKHQAEAVSLQRISQISQAVVPEGEIDDP